MPAIAANCPISVHVGVMAVRRISAASMNSSPSTSHPANCRKTTNGSNFPMPRHN
jgi:hypothetical protein